MDDHPCCQSSITCLTSHLTYNYAIWCILILSDRVRELDVCSLPLVVKTTFFEIFLSKSFKIQQPPLEDIIFFTP